MEQVTRKLTADPTPIERLRPDVPPGLAAVVHKLLARDPADRYRTPVEAAIALTPFAHPAPGFPQRLFLDRSTVVDESGTPTEIPGLAASLTIVVGSADEIELAAEADPTAVAEALPLEPPPTLATAVHPRVAPRRWPLAAGLVLLVLAATASAALVLWTAR